MNHRLLLLSAALVQAAPLMGQAPKPPAACDAALYRALDFCVGEWRVYRMATNEEAARSRIEGLNGGCVIRESWMPIQGSGGSSLSGYDAIRKKWRQSWVDSTGTWVEFAGGPVGKSMVLEGHWPNYSGPGKDAQVRMTYSPQPDGSVIQKGETLSGKSRKWTISFAFRYIRAK